MTSRPARQRALLRRIHLAMALPLLAYVYGPATVADRLQLPLRAAILPALAVSGLVMWQLPTLRRAMARRRPESSG
ncbi:MAG: hypothetical protein JJT89_08755 [Nitriliruptoraceae bacterium]|nr:hypothetical protein [Nitriliruptoraceae bacterium]